MKSQISQLKVKQFLKEGI